MSFRKENSQQFWELSKVLTLRFPDEMLSSLPRLSPVAFHQRTNELLPVKLVTSYHWRKESPLSISEHLNSLMYEKTSESSVNNQYTLHRIISSIEISLDYVGLIEHFSKQYLRKLCCFNPDGWNVNFEML